MPFVPIDIKDQAVQFPNRFKIDGVSRTIEPDFGTVTEPGTPVNRALLQRYENYLVRATEAEALAGADNDKLMTPLRVKQAIDPNLPVVNFSNYTTRATAMDRSSATSLSEARAHGAGATIGNFALMAGGQTGAGAAFATVDAYDTSLVRTTPTALSAARDSIAGGVVGEFALFGGGKNGSTRTGVVNSYTTSLVRANQTTLSEARDSLAAAGNGTHLLFAGGYTSTTVATVDAYTASLVRSTPSALSSVRYRPTGVSIGTFALFAGGQDATNVVNAYNQSLTRTSPTALSSSRSGTVGASTPSHAVMAGGSTTAVDAYTPSLVRSTTTALTATASGFIGLSGKHLALFAAAGFVISYDTSLTRTVHTNLSENRNNPLGSYINGYYLVCGGWTGANSATVDVYDATIAEVLIPAFHSYKFTEATEQLTRVPLEYRSDTALTGYIKPAKLTLSGLNPL